MIYSSSKLSALKINKVISQNFEEIAPIYFKFLSEWMNSSYEKFQDIEKYMIMLYLINKDFEFYINNKLVENYDAFFLYDKSLELDQINIIEISKNLNIPKESVRRKIINLEKFGVLQKIGKKIYIDRSAYKLMQPKKTLQNISSLFAKILELCKKDELIVHSMKVDEISYNIKQNFTYCWYCFYNFIFALTNRWKNQVGDLEIFSVSMVIMLHSTVSSSYVVNGLNFSKWKKNKSNMETIGVNAMSISDITSIPRPTVVRKLNYLKKNKYIAVNKKKLYNLNLEDKALKETTKIQEKNIFSLSCFVYKILKQVKIN